MCQLLEKARDISKTAHAGQVNKLGKDYFTYHIMPIVCLADKESSCAAIVAFLHDTMEDTDVTAKDLEEAGFPTEIVDAVVAITRKKGEDYLDYIRRVKKNNLAKTVKVCDLMVNMDTSGFKELTEKDKARLLKYAKAKAILEQPEED